VKLLFKLSFHKSLEGRKPGEKINKQTSMACVTIQSFMGLPVSTYYHAVKFDICHGCLLELGQKKIYVCLLSHVKNQQQCFIYSTASFLSKLRAKKVEKLHNSSFYRNFRKLNT
jgi:hypothetical protein